MMKATRVEKEKMRATRVEEATTGSDPTMAAHTMKMWRRVGRRKRRKRMCGGGLRARDDSKMSPRLAS